MARIAANVCTSTIKRRFSDTEGVVA